MVAVGVVDVLANLRLRYQRTRDSPADFRLAAPAVLLLLRLLDVDALPGDLERLPDLPVRVGESDCSLRLLLGEDYLLINSH